MRTNPRFPTLSRRALLRAGLAASAATAPGHVGVRPRAAQAADPEPRRYLFVVAAMGGASIIDSFLPVLQSESANGTRLCTYQPSQIAQPAGANLRCVLPLASFDTSSRKYGNGYSQASFLAKHKDDMAIVCVETASVNHDVAQKRALNGGGIDSGRTIMEAAAVRHGKGLPLPNSNMAEGGYGYPGSDVRLAAEARPVAIADPLFLAFGTHGHRGLVDVPSGAAIDRARQTRRRLDALSPFGKTFGRVPSVAHYLAAHDRAGQIERSELMNRLMLLGDTRLGRYGLSPSPQRATLLQAFPSLDSDSFEAQAALAYLLVREGVSCAVTISPSNSFRLINEGTVQRVENTQLAFDNSHAQHRLTQSVMWSRVLKTTDSLIDLLKRAPDPASPGRTLWDSSLVYLATDFGRDKDRPDGAAEFPSGHHLNNGVLLVSPLLKGNRVYGGVDPKTCLTFGFDHRTGAPAPGTTMDEGDLHSVVATALDIPFAGRKDMSALMRVGS